MKIEWTAQAAAELDRMLAYIAAEDLGAAGLVAERVLTVEKQSCASREPAAMMQRPTPSIAISPGRALS